MVESGRALTYIDESRFGSCLFFPPWASPFGSVMTVYLTCGPRLAVYLDPDVDAVTRSVQVQGRPTLHEILSSLGVPDGLFAYGVIGDRFVRLDYRPSEEERIRLEVPVGGG